jgi:hypothetical protein
LTARPRCRPTWTPNLVTWAAADLVGALLTGQPRARGVGWLAVGRGSDAWDDAPPDPDPSRTALEDEVAGVPLRPGADLTFDRATGTVRAAVTLPPRTVVGAVREVGLFGGVASSRPGRACSSTTGSTSASTWARVTGSTARSAWSWATPCCRAPGW